MKQKLFLWIFSFAFFLNYAQENSIEKISIHFAMFKHPNITYTIDFKKNEMTAVMLHFGNDGDEVFNKRYIFSKEHLLKLRSELNKDVPADVLRVENAARDGGGFTITYYKANEKTSKLIVSNADPKEEKFKKPLQKIEAFFNFAYSIISDPESIDILDSSYSPYFSGLPIKKSFNSPLEYKIWGTVSGGEFDNKEFFTFLDNLPHDKCVIIDCHNNLSYALQEAILKLYIIKFPNLKFVNNDYLKYTREDLFKIRRQINTENKDFEKNTAYKLYMSDRKAMDKWLALPDGQWNINIRAAIKSCQ